MERRFSNRKNIHIWSIPKSGSTVLSKAFDCRSDTKSVVEHFLTERNKTGERILYVSSRRDDYEFVKSYLDQQSAVNKVTVSKEHAFVYSPWIDLGCLEKYIMEDAQHVILFRDPMPAMQSYQHIQTTANPDDIVPEVREEEVSFEPLKKLYLHTFPNNILLDFVDIVYQPKKCLSMLCQRLGISDESESMSHWGARQTSIDQVLRDPGNAIWFNTLRCSNGIDSKYVNDRSNICLSDDMQRVAEKNQEIFEFLTERKDVLF